MKVNTTQKNNADFEIKLYELREIVEPQLNFEFGSTLKFFSTGTGDPDGRLIDGGFLILKGRNDEDWYVKRIGESQYPIDQWIHSTAQDVGFGGAYRLHTIPFASTGLIVYRVYDR